MKILEQLQSPKLWSVIIGLLVSFGLFQFSDSQSAEVAAAATALFTAIGVIVNAVLSQQGDNAAKVETARSLSSWVIVEGVPRELAYIGEPGRLTPDEESMAWPTMVRTIRSHELLIAQLAVRVKKLEKARAMETTNEHG